MKWIPFLLALMMIGLVTWISTISTPTGYVVQEGPQPANPKEPGKVYDLFEEDALQYGDITSKDISVRGIQVGDTVDALLEYTIKFL